MSYPTYGVPSIRVPRRPQAPVATAHRGALSIWGRTTADGRRWRADRDTQGVRDDDPTPRVASLRVLFDGGGAVGASYRWDGSTLTAADVQAPGAAFPAPAAVLTDLAAALTEIEQTSDALGLAASVLWEVRSLRERDAFGGRLYVATVGLPGGDEVWDAEQALRAIQGLTDPAAARAALVASGAIRRREVAP